VLFSFGRNSYTRLRSRLFTLSLAEGGRLAEEVPLPMARARRLFARWRSIAYEPLNQWQPEWKRYQGGQLDYLWIARLS
jgi:hypothetical protein